MRNKPFYLSDDHVRSFGGKLNGFENRDESMREKKHLKAYLAGKKVYSHGFESVPFHVALGIQVETDGIEDLTTDTVRRPKLYEVKENWTPKTQK
jgi:hypothetical protein